MITSIMRSGNLALRISILLLCAALPRVGSAVTITIDATDLPDVIVGEDLWRASYNISGMSFAAGQGFTIYFDHSLYRNLSSVPPAPANWDLLLVQPDVGLSVPGFLDGLALVNSPSLAQPFLVDFVWLGAGSPGSQAFEIYDLSGGFRVIESGRATVNSVAVPESGPGLAGGLTLLMLVAASAFSRRRRCAAG